MTLSKGDRLAKLAKVWDGDKYVIAEPKRIVEGEAMYDWEIVDLSPYWSEYTGEPKNDEVQMVKLRKVG